MMSDADESSSSTQCSPSAAAARRPWPTCPSTRPYGGTVGSRQRQQVEQLVTADRVVGSRARRSADENSVSRAPSRRPGRRRADASTSVPCSMASSSSSTAGLGVGGHEDASCRPSGAAPRPRRAPGQQLAVAAPATRRARTRPPASSSPSGTANGPSSSSRRANSSSVSRLQLLGHDDPRRPPTRGRCRPRRAPR